MKDKIEVRKHIKDVCIKSMELNRIAKDKATTNKKKVYEQQDEMYKKFQFLKGMYKELNKEKK